MKLTKKISAAVFAFGVSAIATTAQAVVINYDGVVTGATGAFAGLIGPGTVISGPIDYDDAAVASGLVGPTDFNDITISVGAFCFATGSGCAVGASVVPITSIPNAAVTFSAGEPTGGSFDVIAFSPTFQASVPIAFDLTAGTFFGDGAFLGTVEGTFAPSSPVPVPAAAWLFGSAMLGLAGIGRSRKAA